MQAHSTAEHVDSGLLPVSVTVSIVAVLLAFVSLLGHRAHTRTLFAQNQTIAEWVYYESKATGRTSYDALLDFLPAAPLRDPAAALKLKDKYQQKIAQSDREQKQIQTKANALEAEVAQGEHAADRFDLGDACLEGSLVIISLTLLTKRRLYWGIGLAFASAGVAIAATGFFVA